MQQAKGRALRRLAVTLFMRASLRVSSRKTAFDTFDLEDGEDQPSGRKQEDEHADDEDGGVHFVPLFARWRKYSPVERIDGTHSPTKTPASLSAGPIAPNQSETEKRNEMNAALRIK